MNFVAWRFWGYLFSGLASILVARFFLGRLRPNSLPTFDKLGLLGLGLFLLFCVNSVTFVIFLVVAIVTYVGLAWIQAYHPQHALKYLVVLIPLQLAPLIYFKYANFACNSVMHLNYDSLRDLVIPVGISFYTFQKVAFVVDTLAFGHPRPRFLDYMNFAGFFPQIVAGPIERRGDLLPQMEAFRFRWLPQQINEGVGWVALGFFFKCCLADNLAAFFGKGTPTNAVLVWLDNLLFGLRIYYDFTGYSLIAVGVARCLGVKLTLNFLSPYCSTSITELWRRWHVTLSQWFRDYIYIPMGGGRSRFWMFNVAVVFLVSGVWHGAGWNFVLWGALHAVFCIANRLWTWRKPPAFVGWSVTMVACFYAWLCFYENNTSVLLAKMKLLLNPMAYRPATWQEALNSFPAGHRFTLGGFLLLVAGALTLEWLSVSRKNEVYYYLRQPWVLVVLVFLTVLLVSGKNNGFIYFAF